MFFVTIIPFEVVSSSVIGGTFKLLSGLSETYFIFIMLSFLNRLFLTLVMMIPLSLRLLLSELKNSSLIDIVASFEGNNSLDGWKRLRNLSLFLG